MSERITVNVVDAAQGAPAATRRPSPADASVYFVNVQRRVDASRRATVIRFGLTNMGIAPAGVEKPNTGHHHLLIDTPLPPLDRPIPNDFNHLHFGAGQTEARVALNPGAPHAAAPVRRREPCAARSAGDVEADQGDGGGAVGEEEKEEAASEVRAGPGNLHRTISGVSA